MASADQTKTTITKTTSFSPSAAVLVIFAAIFLYYTVSAYSWFSILTSSSFSILPSSLISVYSSFSVLLSSSFSVLLSLFSVLYSLLFSVYSSFSVLLSSSFSVLYSSSFSVLLSSFSVLYSSFNIFLSSSFSVLSFFFSLCSSFSILLSSSLALPSMPLIQASRMAAAGDCFLYFAYGSNLLTKRIHINNPSARMMAVGKLKDYRLDFGYFSQRWKGAVATIVEAPGDYVYGVVWEIKNEDMTNLDRQEGVSKGIYRVLKVDVETEDGEQVAVRSYQLTQPKADDPRPSAVYIDVIIKGARENGLPEDYIKFLENIEHNKYSGEVDVNLDLSNQQQQQQQPTQPVQ